MVLTEAVSLVGALRRTGARYLNTNLGRFGVPISRPFKGSPF